MDEQKAIKQISKRLHNEDYERIILDKESYAIYHSYMNLKMKRSKNSYYSTKSNLRSFFKLYEKPLRDLKRSDMIYYLNVLNSREDIKKSTKEEIKASLDEFFNYVKRKFNLKGIKYLNPMPKFFLFTQEPTKTLKERFIELESEFFTIDELKTIIRMSIEVPFETRMAILIQMFSGCRISELVTINREDILHELNYFESGKTHSFQKTGLVKFVLPPEIIEILINYLKYHQEKYGKEQKWLFPSPNAETHISRKTFRRHLAKWFPQIQNITKTHRFRKTIARYRRLNQAPRSEREFLSNHKLSVVDTHYAVRTIEERNQSYLANFPTEYREILDLVEIYKNELKKYS